MIVATFIAYWLAAGAIVVLADHFWLKHAQPFLACSIMTALIMAGFGGYLWLGSVLLGERWPWFQAVGATGCMAWQLLCVKLSRNLIRQRALREFKESSIK